MPIKPENKNRYPKNWKDIRNFILKRANNRCEFCGIENKSIIVYRYNGKNIDDYDYAEPSEFSKYKQFEQLDKTWTEYEEHKQIDYRKAKVILTVAHLDHTPENCSPLNLRALCQRCHNKYDAKHRAETRKKRTISLQ